MIGMAGRAGWWLWVALLLPSMAPARDRLKELEQRMARLEAELARRPQDISDLHLPNRVTFCGEEVDLEDPWIRERLEKEFILVLGDRAQVLLWLKRARSVFPAIEAEAERVGACKDLKYLAVVESSLRPAVSSHAQAKGWWQFMSATAKQYGLDVDKAWDERADLQSSTRAGLKYLLDLRNRFGNWSLAMAAYNTGPNRLQKARETQGLGDFWRLDLYEEAERYVPRIIAVKVVMSDLKAYGFQQTPKDGWPLPATAGVQVRLASGREVPVIDLALGTGIDYRVLRQLNPELGSDLLPMNTQFMLAVPPGRERAVKAWLDAAATGTPIKRRPGARFDPVVEEDAPEERPARSERLGGVPEQPEMARVDRPEARPEPQAAPRTEAARAAPRTEAPAVGGKGARYHVVEKGESLWSLAQDHKVSVGDLRRWNQLDNRTALKPGQRIIVRPGKQGT